MATYDPFNNIVNFGGVDLGGWAEGTVIEIERDEDTFSKKVGTNGDVCWVRNRNRGGKAKLTLMQDSLSNDVLSNFMSADEALGTGVQPFQMTDAAGTTVVHASAGRISKPGAVKRGKEHNSVEWTIDLADVDVFIGGHS